MTQAVESDLAALAERVRVLEEERAVMTTLHRYGHAIDYNDKEGWLDCFTEDGAFDIRNRLGPRILDEGFKNLTNVIKHPQGARFEGRNSLDAFFVRHTHAPEVYHKHYVIEPRIAIDRDHASVDSYFIVMHEVGGRPHVTAMGRYRDRMMRGKDGRWRFRERISEMEAFAPPVPQLA